MLARVNGRLGEDERFHKLSSFHQGIPLPQIRDRDQKVSNQPETKILNFISRALTEESCKVHVTFVPRIITLIEDEEEEHVCNYNNIVKYFMNMAL